MRSDLIRLILDFLADSNKSARKAGAQATKKVTRVSRDFSEQAEDFRRSVSKRMQRRPSTGKGIAVFAAGFGIGMGAALLLAPLSGKDLRSKISDSASDSFEQISRRGSKAV